jgi:hypothetical protein
VLLHENNVLKVCVFRFVLIKEKREPLHLVLNMILTPRLISYVGRHLKQQTPHTR